MTTGTEVKPISETQAYRAMYCVDYFHLKVESDEAVCDALCRIGDGRHEVIDKATHAAVSHERLTQMEANAKRWEFVEANPYRAIDLLRDSCGTYPAAWGLEARRAIDAALSAGDSHE